MKRKTRIMQLHISIKREIILLMGMVVGVFATASNLVVGDYNASAGVSPSGAASFSMPIECPKGVNGMEPKISLNYNSQSGYGNAGYGWNVAATSVITKALATPYYNGKCMPINGDYQEEYLSLDGQRLIKYKEISESEVEFRTENDNYNRIVRYGTILDYYFKVYTTDGKILTYNQLKEGSNYYHGNLGWYLTKVEDLYGNYMTYEYYYYATNNYIYNIDRVRLTSIQYGGNSTVGNAHTCRVDFEYEIGDIPDYYVSKYCKKRCHVFSSVKTYSNNTLNTKYEFVYGKTNNSTRLKEIKKYGNNEDYLQSVKVNWNEYNFSPTETINRSDFIEDMESAKRYDLNGNSIITYVHNYTGKQWFASDYNNDGYTDVLSFCKEVVLKEDRIGHLEEEYYIHVQYYKNDKGEQKNERNEVTQMSKDFIVNTQMGALMSCHFTKRNEQNTILPCLYLNKDEGRQGDIMVLVNLMNPSDRCEIQLLNQQPEMPCYSCADLNKDGYDDIIIVERGHNNCRILWGGSYSSLAEQTKNGKITNLAYSGGGSYLERIAVCDMNNDGLLDIALICNDGYSFIRNNGTVDNGTSYFSSTLFRKNPVKYNSSNGNVFLCGDFNGDGSPDFFKTENKDYVIYANEVVSNGELGYSEKRNLWHGVTDLYGFTMDINGDGTLDVCTVAKDYFSCHTFKQGRNNQLYGTALLAPVTQNHIILGDFDADGLPEILSVGEPLMSTTQTTAREKKNAFFINKFITNGDGNYVSSISTPLHTYKFTYAPLTDKSVYSRTKTFAESENLVNLLCPIYVVKEFNVDGVKSTYSYSNAVCEATGKGFLGFLTTKCVNDLSTTVQTNGYKTSPALVYPSNSTIASVSGVFKKTTFSFSFPFLTGTKAYHQQLNSTKEQDLLNENTVTSTYSSFKLNVPTVCKVDYGNGITSIVNLTTKQNSTYNMVLPTQKKETLTNKDGSYTRTTTYSYNNKQSLSSETALSGTDRQVKKSYTYDSFGNVSSVKTEATGCETLKDNYGYSSSGRFLTSSKYGDGTSATYTYDEKYGRMSKCVSSVGSLSYTTSYTSFDGFNNCLKKTLPDGRVESTTLSYVSNDPMKAKYVVKTSLQGSSNKWVYYDVNGNVVNSSNVYVTGERLNQYYSYDKYGRLTAEYQLTGSNTPTDQSKRTYLYDEYGRIEQISSLVGDINYTYLKNKTVEYSPMGTTTKEYNPAGQLLKSTENGKSVSFTYYPSGLMKSSTDVHNNLTISFEYDIAGNRTKINDPDVGTISSIYDNYGREIQRTTEKGAVITYEYDSRGRLIKEYDDVSQNTFTYNNNNQLTKETSNNYSCSYTYDIYGRMTQKSEKIAGKSFITNYTFANKYDGPSAKVFPTGLQLSYGYDEYGNLTSTKLNSKALWSPTKIDAKGRLTEETLFNTTKKYEYDRCGRLTRESAYYGTTGLMDLNYTYSGVKLTGKSDALSSCSEKYTYDELNRLSQVERINGTTTKKGSITYDALGNQSTAYDNHWKSIAYGGDGKAPHEVSSVTYKSYAPNGKRTVSTDAYRMVDKIVEGDLTYQITYRPDHTRCMTQLYKGGKLQRTKYYCDGFENEVDASGKERKIHYLCGATGLSALYVIDNGKDSLFTAVTDRQNSLTAVMANAGKKVERFAYDPWGLLRNPADWTVNVVKGRPTRFGRGYCMHEHICELGLIDMGGRIYDAHTHQFLTPDPYMQAPESWLNHNRYAYCMQNPVMYTDPDGEMPWFVPVIIGAVIGTYSGGTLANDGELNLVKWDYSSGQTWGYMLGGSIAGAVSGFCGSMVTASEIPFANTLGIVASSFTNSVLTHVYTGGDAPVSVSFGFGSYNFSNNSFGFLGKKGNSVLDNVGYALGALANLSDVLAGLHPEKVDLVTEHSDATGHSAIVNPGTETGSNYPMRDPNAIISVGPNPKAPGSWHWKKGINGWYSHSNKNDKIWRQSIVTNKKIIETYGKWLDELESKGKLIYSVELSSCVTHTSVALNLSGVFNIGIHPYILNAQMALWSNGIRPWTFCYQLQNY